MTHDDPDKEALFQKFWPSLLCQLLFHIGDIIGFIRWWYHFPMFKLLKRLKRKSWEKHSDWVYEYMKAKDEGCCVAVFNGQHDETISNKCGTIFIEKGFSSPYYVILIKKVTHRMEADHLEKSIEPLRKKGKV